MKEYINKLLVSVLVLVGTIACEREYLVPDYDNFSDAVAAASGNTKIQRGDFTSFADLSKGVTERRWNIPESASVLNLNGKSPSELDIIHVKFDEPGEFEVNLQSDFEVESVSLDTTFSVTVFDYIQTDFEIESIDAGFYEQTPTQISMYEGGTITYNDISLGNPNRRAWLFSGGDPSVAGGISIEDDQEVKKIVVSYPTIGTYDVQLVTWRQYPTGEPDTLLLENYINVIENVDPASLVSITENKEGVIHLLYNLPLKTSGNLTPNFTLKVDGSEAVISSVSINAEDNRIVDITPAVNTDNGSVATISYDGNGDLARLNDVAVEAFSEEEVTLYVSPNIADNVIYGFEDGGTGWDTNVVWAWDNVGLISFTDEKAATGQYSMRMEATSNARCRAYSRKAGSTFSLEAGKNYTIEYKVWIDPSYTDASIVPELIHNTSWAVTGFWTSLNGLPRSEWVTINKESVKTFTPPATGEYFMSFKFQKIGIIYIDDIKIYEVD